MRFEFHPRKPEHRAHLRPWCALVREPVQRNFPFEIRLCLNKENRDDE